MPDTGLEAMRIHSRHEFQIWLANEVEVRSELESIIGVELDTTEASLDTLEDFLLGRFERTDDALRLDQRAVLDAAARHVGLVMLLNVDGASWAIDLDNTENVYYRLPIIRFSDGAEECPLTMVTAALDRRTGDYLRTIVENYEEDYNAATNE
jgi:hypothetical protein